ncbi:unnamed protein product [Effrenium voratum]|uniref:Uncharacterized protein n=1 Tax=Effrenium voratum TaxID=2562239 RepID=A0AA36IVS9_9DINO|nr:unnamed protein product [Effrenium voratum]
MGKRGQKRALDSGEEVPLRSDELRPPEELPEREAAAVRAALERWRELRMRAEVLRPMLEHEDRLMQDILDRGLGSEDRKTLRKLASVGARDAEAEAAQVAESVGQERQRLQEILMQNHRELLELSTTTTPDDKKELIAEMDGVLDELKKAQDAVHVELLATKDNLYAGHVCRPRLWPFLERLEGAHAASGLRAEELDQKFSFGDSAGDSLQTDTASAADRSFRADEHSGTLDTCKSWISIFSPMRASTASASTSLGQTGSLG